MPDYDRRDDTFLKKERNRISYHLFHAFYTIKIEMIMNENKNSSRNAKRRNERTNNFKKEYNP